MTEEFNLQKFLEFAKNQFKGANSNEVYTIPIEEFTKISYVINPDVENRKFRVNIKLLEQHIYFNVSLTNAHDLAKLVRDNLKNSKIHGISCAYNVSDAYVSWEYKLINKK